MTAENDGFKTERWRYAGRRMGTKGKLLATFVDEQGEDMPYAMGKGVTHGAVGATYTIEVKRGEDGHATARFGTLTFVEAGDHEDPVVQEWQARDRAAFTTDLVTKAEAKAKRDTLAWESMTLSDLREHYVHLPWGQQTALIAQVIRYLQMSRT